MSKEHMNQLKDIPLAKTWEICTSILGESKQIGHAEFQAIYVDTSSLRRWSLIPHFLIMASSQRGKCGKG